VKAPPLLYDLVFGEAALNDALSIVDLRPAASAVPSTCV